MHVRHLSRGKTEVAEDHVLDSAREERVAVRSRFTRFLLDEMEQHREVMDTERPERVLVRPERAEVLTVAVDVENVAELPRIDDLLQPPDRGVVQQQVTGHQNAGPLFGEITELFEFRRAHRRRLLDEDVLVRFERTASELVVRRYRS